MTRPSLTVGVPLLLLVSLLSTPSNAALHQSIDEIPSNAQYDYIVVGGGLAGNVVASRLSEDSSKRVLLLEAGPTDTQNEYIPIPFENGRLFGSEVDWNFTSTPQTGAFNRTIPMIRGKTLGGSSSVNHMTWHRASNDYWNNFGNLVGDSSWSWAGVSGYYNKSQRLVASADGHDQSQEVIAAAHGYGPVQISTGGYRTSIDQRVRNSATNGGRFPYNPDVNAGNTIGIGYAQSSVNSRGERSSSSTAYLYDNSAINRSNLDVVVNARVVKVSASTPHATGTQPRIDTVQIANSPGVTPRNITAQKEIIVSGGAFSTPQLLLLSGIGPQDELSSPALRIPVVANVPGVGKNLADHPLLPNYWRVADNTTFDDLQRTPSIEQQAIQQWQTNRSGIMVMPHSGNLIGYFKNPAGFRGGEDPSSGPGAANTEMIYLNGWANFGIPVPQTGNFLTILTAVVSVTSLGQVTLRSSNPFDAPLINPNIYSTDYDIQSMVQAMKDAETVLNYNASGSPWNGYIIEKVNVFNSDDERANFARNTSITVSHGSGSVKMGNSDDAPVDTKLRLKGVQGLRVVDASVFPKIPECHPQAVVYVIAEKAADLIKADQ